MKIDVNGVTLNYEVVGKGRPMLLVHGNTMDHTCFKEGVELLKEHYTCYLVDSRGHGESSKVGEYHYDDMCNDYIEFCNKLDLKDIYYYGLSDGGIIGLLIASRSNIISKMVISGTNTYVNGITLNGRATVVASYLLKRDKRLLMCLREPNISKEELNKISAKTMVCAGSKDAIKESDTKFIANNIPDALLNIMEGETHVSTVINSDKFARNCINFFED